MSRNLNPTIDPRTVDPRGKDSKTKLFFSRLVSYFMLILISFICIFPFVMLIVNSTKNHTDITQGFNLMPGSNWLNNFKNMLERDNMPILSALFNSLYVSTLAATLTTYFSAMTAYGIHTYVFKFRKALFTFILFIMMIPAQVSTLGFLDLVAKMNLRDTFVPLIVPAIAAPAVFYYIKQYMESVLPHEVVESARVDGAGEFRIFNTIVLPMIKPAIAVQAIFSFVFSWNNYFIPNLIIDSDEKKTIPILIAQLRAADYASFDMGQVYMMICVAILPILVVYLLLSRFIISGVTSGSVKG
jgi:multiple sugar transport system permease protein